MPDRAQRRAPAPELDQLAQPFARVFVEGANRRAGAEPQHMLQPVRLRLVERDRHPGRQRVGDIEARGDAFGQITLLFPQLERRKLWDQD